MQESRLVKRFQRGGKRAQPHGYSFLTRKLDSQGKLRIVRYLSGCRDALLEDLGGEQNVSAQKLILVDRCVCLLGILRAVEEFHAENILTEDGQLQPALKEHYIAYVNATRLILTSLGLEKVPMDQAINPIEYIRRYDERKGTKDEG